MKLRKWASVVMLILAATMMFGCGKRYVGHLVDTSHPAWYRVKGLPDQGRIANVGPLAATFTIEEGEGPDNYIVTGEFDASSGSAKSFNNILPEKSQFALLVASNGIVIDNISFLVRGTNLNQPLPFQIKFHCEAPIEAIAFWYRFYMKG